MKRHYIPVTADVPGVSEGTRSFLRRVIRTALAEQGVDFPCEVDVLVTGDAGIHTINLEMRGVDRPTDVLSFPEFELTPGELPGAEDADPGTGYVPLGDMVISLERVKAQAKEYGHANRRELAYLAVHSVLHLLGYDHLDEGPMKAQMREREEAIMSVLGLERRNGFNRKGGQKMDTVIRPYRPGEERYVAELHKRLYSEEYAWGPSFTDYAAKIALDFAKKEKSDKEELFVAELNGSLAGCIMLCQTDDPSVGQLRLFAVEKAYRRYGIGSALIQAVMDKVKAAGYQKVILWTASPLAAAIRHYEKLGFKAVESVENATWATDGSPLREIKMELSL